MFGDALTFSTEDTIRTVIQSEDVVVKEEIRWLEYGAGAMGKWRFINWEPYLGVRFSWLGSTDKINDQRVGKLNLEEENNIGIFGGADVYWDRKENIAVNVETSLLDQSSIKIGLKLWY